jgi:hypothetical protein
MANGSDRSVPVEFEREPHALARGDELADRAPIPRHERPMEGRSVRLDECVRHNLRRLGDPWEGVFSEGEAEGEPGPHPASHPGEFVPLEAAVGSMPPSKVLHGPLQRPPDSFEGSGDLGAPVRFHGARIPRKTISPPGSAVGPKPAGNQDPPSESITIN